MVVSFVGLKTDTEVLAGGDLDTVHQPDSLVRRVVLGHVNKTVALAFARILVDHCVDGGDGTKG